MKQSKLIEIFNSLTKKEKRDLGKFVRSPYFNQREDVIKLYDYLNRYSTDNESLNKESAFHFIYPTAVYSEKQIRYVMSFLFQAVRAFLAIDELEKDPIHFQSLVARSLRKRNTDRAFQMEWKVAKNQLDKQKTRNQDYHYKKYFLKYQQFLASKNQSRSAIPGLQGLSDELTHFFIADTLRQSCLALSYQTITQVDFRQNMLPYVIEYVEQNDFSNIPAVLIYFYGYKLLSGEEPLKNFKTLSNHIVKDGHCFPSNELKDIYLLALNFCIRKVNEGITSFKREAFELYKKGLEQEVFIENNQLSRFTYKNIVAIALGLGEFNWVENFIESFTPFLKKKYRHSAYCFNLALYHFKKEEYGKAMELLQQVGTDDVLNNLNARRMLLRIYYDLDEMDALESLLGSFQTYIYRKKELGYHRDLYLNLIRFTRKLLQLNFRDKEKVTALKKELDNKEKIAEKAWLLEKLNQSPK
ncbi:MAG: hypothetical protein AAFZ15_03915 [Bacteroidota bacterium]